MVNNYEREGDVLYRSYYSTRLVKLQYPDVNQTVIVW